MAIFRNFSFAGGEIAPSLYARTDQAKYQTGARVMKNMYVSRSGGAFQRPGTTFIGEVKDSTSVVRLIPFIFSSTDAYVLECGVGYIRFIKEAAYVTETPVNILHIVRGSTTTITFTGAHGLVTGDAVSLSGIGGTTELNGRDFLVKYVSTTQIEIKSYGGIAVDSSSYGVYTSGGLGAQVYTITAPYTAAQLPNIKFTQSADVMYLVCSGVAPRVLSRISNADWLLETLEIESDQANITSASNNGASAGSNIEYTVHGLGADGEIGQGAITTTNSVASSGSPITVTFSTTSTAASYMVLRNDALIGYTATNTFVDNGITPQWYDLLGSAPMSEADTLFLSTARWPGCVGFYQQRLFFGDLYDDFTEESFPERVAASFIGHYRDFFTLGPIADNAAFPFSFDVAGRQLNTILHLVDLERLVIFTPAGVYVAQGDESGAVSSTSINLKQVSYTGSSNLRPLIANESLIYNEARRSIVRDLNFQIQSDGYKGNDLTVFAKHMFDGYTIEDWDFQLNPDSMLFAARNDGVLLGLTYVKEQQITGWHRHTFSSALFNGLPDEGGGTVENVVSIPEGDTDAVYLTVRRQNASFNSVSEKGREKLYVERFEIAPITDVKDLIYSDSALTYDGRNTDTTHTMTLSGGSDWTYQATLTLTSSTAFFTAADVGNEIQLSHPRTGGYIRFRITGYTSTTVVTGNPHATVPTLMRSSALSDWTRAVDEVSGLWHLEGYKVSVVGDGFVVASPNNDHYDVLTVTDGAITLPQPYGVIHVGLPYVADLETLDIDLAEGGTIVDKKKNIQRVSVWVENTRSLRAGLNPNDDTSIENMEEPALRENEGYDDPIDLVTGVVEINLASEWNSNGRILLRNTDPMPMNILSIAPAGYLPGRR